MTRDEVLATIKKQKQKNRHEPDKGLYGDCYRTAIACILGLDRDEVPHFYSTPEDTTGEQVNQAKDWLSDRGYDLVLLAFDSSPLEVMGKLNPTVPYMLMGMGRSGVNHCVVALGDEIVWDPSLADSGVVGPSDDGYFWIEIISGRINRR